MEVNKQPERTEEQRRADKIKQWIALIGGFLGALILALRASGVELTWLDEGKLKAWENVAYTLIPFLATGYGIYKNQYLLTKKGKAQEKVLKRVGLK